MPRPTGPRCAECHDIPGLFAAHEQRSSHFMYAVLCSSTEPSTWTLRCTTKSSPGRALSS
eukprot:2713900-Rhodomonas_salina.1